MIRERDDWTCFTCGTRINPRARDGFGKSMKFFMHAGHYKPQGIYKSVKYDPLQVHAQCEHCNIDMHGNLSVYAVALEKRYAFGILQTIERRTRLYFDYTIPVLEKLTAAAKRGAQEYFLTYELVRPKEEREKTEVASAA